MYSHTKREGDAMKYARGGMIIKCDRCGKKHSTKDGSKIANTKSIEVNLCQSCTKAFNRWLNAFNREVKTDAES